MIIETAFSLDDQVYKIWRIREKYYETCAFCGGTNEIVGADGSKKSCPECRFSEHHGYKGKKIEYRDLAWKVTGTVTVGQVRIQVDKKETEESYMCRETGIGSGTIHYKDTLYKTREEAQAECDKRNEEDKIKGETNG